MKNFIKIFIFALVAIMTYSCVSDDGSGRFANDPEYGWVRFFDFDTSTNISISEIDCPDLDNPISTIEIPVELTARINKSDLNVTYELQGVSGTNPTDFISGSGTVTIPANSNKGVILLNIDNTISFSSDISFNVLLTSTNRSGITVGLDDNSELISYTVNLKLYDLTGTYSATSITAFGGDPAPLFTAEVTPIDGEPNKWDIDTSWGPNFIAWATGVTTFEDSLFYKAILEVDPATGNITIIGNDDDDDFGDFDLGGSGTFNRCDGVLSYSVDGTFFGGVTANVVLQKQ